MKGFYLSNGGGVLVFSIGGGAAKITAAASLAAPTLSGSEFSQQNLSRGVTISSIDTSTLFLGSGITYSVDTTLGSNLPDGLSLNSSSGLITGTPTVATVPTELPTVYIKATNSTDSVTDDDGITFAVTGPALTIDSVTQNDVAISTDDSGGTVYWAFCNITNPSDGALIAGSGTGVLISGNFLASSGGDTIDLTDEVGTSGYMVFLQVNAAGAYSNVPFTAITPVAVAPEAFVDANWSVSTGSGDMELDVVISSLPEDGGATISDVQYDVDGDVGWTSLPSYSGTGSYTITMAGSGTNYGIRLRAVNSAGNGDPGNTENATSGGAVGTIPSFKAVGTGIDGNSDISVPWPTHVTGDVGILVVGCRGNDTIPASISGWTKLGEFNQTTTSGFPKFGAFWRVATSSSESNVTVPNMGPMNTGIIYTYEDCDTVAVLGTEQFDANTTAVSMASGTTTNDDTLVVGILMVYEDATPFDPSFTNGNLASITYRGGHGTTLSADHHIVAFDGEKETAGAVGTTTATLNTAKDWVGVHLELYTA